MSRPSTVSRAPFVRYSCARWMGLRVWKPTTRRQPRSSNALRVSAGSSASSGNGRLGPVEDGHLAGEVQRMLAVQARDSGMCFVGRPEAALGLAFLVVLEDLVNLEDGQGSSVAVGQRDAVSLGCRFHGEADGKSPGEPVREVHVLDHALVVLAAHEALERRQRARGEHVQVGHFARGECQRLERLEVVRPFAGAVDERPTMGLDQTCPSAWHCDMAHAGTSSSTRPSSASLPRMRSALSSGVRLSVSTRSSGRSGAS